MQRYLSRPEIGAYLGVTANTAAKFDLPEPDAVIGRLPGWLPETVDAWHSKRPGRGRWGARRRSELAAEEVGA